MFEFLTGSKNHFIGIDFGTSSIKVVELSYLNQKAKLENYGIVDLNWDSGNDHNSDTGASSYEQKLNSALRGLIEKMKLKNGSKAFVSIPGFSGIITLIEFPDMPEDDLAKAIGFEAHKYIPSSLDEVAMSWEVVERSQDVHPSAENAAKGGGKKIKVLLVAAPKKDIEHYDRLVSGVNFDVSAIELETFSISRSLVGADMGNFFVIDIGSRATNMILVEKGVVRVNRNIDAGGNEITTAIIDSMNISRQRAEDFKRSDKDLINTKGSALFIPVLDLIVNESKRILSSYMQKNNIEQLDGIILSGGTSKMKGLEQYFSAALGQSVSIGNPWSKIEFEPNLKPLVSQLGASFSVAVGLALRGMEEYKRE
ncbi:MAG: type IV pilus assembly protein PilM [bacterium]